MLKLPTSGSGLSTSRGFSGAARQISAAQAIVPVKYLERSVGPSTCSRANDERPRLLRRLRAPTTLICTSTTRALPQRADGAIFTPPDALVSDYLKVRARLGITRTVVVQPSTYGKDNTCTLGSQGGARAFGARHRGGRRDRHRRRARPAHQGRHPRHPLFTCCPAARCRGRSWRRWRRASAISAGTFRCATGAAASLPERERLAEAG